MLLCGNNLQLMAYEMDNVSAGNNRESGNKRLGTLTEILTTSPFFSPKTEYTCIVTPRPANNYLMQHGDCSDSLIGRTCSLSVYYPPPFLLLSWRIGKACKKLGFGWFSDCR